MEKRTISSEKLKDSRNGGRDDSDEDTKKNSGKGSKKVVSSKRR